LQRTKSLTFDVKVLLSENQSMVNRRILSSLFMLSALLLSQCGKDNVDPKDIGIYINEIDPNGTDWLELYNSTSASVSLRGFKVYDDASNKYPLGSITIPAKGFYVLFCDGTGVGGNASFRLNSDGETISLEDNTGRLLDEITYPAVDNGSSYARFPDGADDWRLTGIPTQGETNGNENAATVSGVTRLPIVPNKTQTVTITATIIDVQGITTVKLFHRKNGGAYTAINMTLATGKYSAAIPAANELGTVEYYIEVVNSRNVTTLQPKDALTDPYSYLLNEDALPNLRINEFMAFNTSTISDPDGAANEFDDWIEIYNAGSEETDLNGFYLSDNNGNPFKFKIEGETKLEAGGYLLIWADEQGAQGKLHASFQLAAAGEEVGLYYFDGRTIDYKLYNVQAENKSYGRPASAPTTWVVLSTPTPGLANPNN
jgi:hypothetical protein